MPPDEPAGREHRLHPATLVFGIGNSVKTLLLPVLAVILLSGSRVRYPVWLAVLFVPAVLYQVFRYFTLTYRFAETEMVVRHGVVFRQERHIPYDRIDNVGLVQGPLHRMVGVAKVRLETAGSSQPEAELDVLSLAAVEHLRERVLAGRTVSPATAETGDAEPRPPEAAAEAPTVLVELPRGEVVKLGLISLRGLLIIPVLFGLAEQLDLWERIDFDWLAGAVESAAEQGARPLLVAGLAVGAVLLFLGLSVGWTALRFHGYRLERTGEQLRVTCGLFTKVSASVGRPRIQVVTVHETPGHRLFRRLTIRVETAGGVDEKVEISRKWFVPLLPRGEVARVLGELRPGLDLGQISWRPLAPKAVRRKVVRNILFALPIAAALVATLWPWGLAPASLLVAWAVVHAVLWVRRTRYGLTDDGLAYLSGIVTRQTTATFFDKIQVVSLAQSPFDRRHRMATLTVDTAGAGGQPVRIPYLEEAVAQDLFRTLSVQAETSTMGTLPNPDGTITGAAINDALAASPSGQSRH
jgi:putative membrane protein